MNRRQFIQQLTLNGGGLFLLVACGSGSMSSDGGNSEIGEDGDCSTGAPVTYTNPGHAHSEIAMTADQIDSATPGNYTLLSGDHSHTFNLTSADFTDLKNGNTVSVTDNEGHNHQIDIAC